MASIFDYYGDMYRGMEDRAAEKEAVLNARKDAMFAYLDKFPYMEDETIDAFAEEQGVSPTTVTAIKNQRNKNIEDRELLIEKQQIANESALGELNLFKDTYNNKIILSDQKVTAGAQSIEGTTYDNILKKETLNNSIKLSDLELEDKELELEIKKATKDDVIDLSRLEVESKIALINSTNLDNEKKKILLPYVQEEIEQKLRKGELDIDRLQQIMDQDDQLFPGKLKLQMQEIIAGDLSNEEKRLQIAELIKENKRQEIRFLYEEQGLKTEQIDQMYTVMDKIMETFPDMTPDEAREVALILGFQGENLDTIVNQLDEIKKQNNQVRLEKDIGFNSTINSNIQTRFTQILENNISAFGVDGYSKEDIIEAVYLEMTAGITDETQKKLIREMIENYANTVTDQSIEQLQTNTWVSTLNSDVVQQHIQTMGTRGLDEILRANGVPEDAIKNLIERTEFVMMENLIQKMYTDKALAEEFLTGDQQRVEQILNAFGLYYPGGTLTQLEWFDDIKKRVENHQKFNLINSDKFTTAVDDSVENYQANNNKRINSMAENKEIEPQVAQALNAINTKYVLSSQELEIVMAEVNKMFEEDNSLNGLALENIWIANRGNAYNTIEAYEQEVKNNVSGGNTKFNSASNQDQNEGYVGIEKILTGIESSINNQLSEFNTISASSIQDLDLMVVDFEDTVKTIEEEIYKSARNILFEKSGGKEPSDEEIKNHAEYKKEMDILNEYKTTILDAISAKKEEVKNRITKRNESLSQEEKFTTGKNYNYGRFQSREEIRKYIKENDLGDMTIQDLLDRFEISNQLKRGINNQIKSGNLSLTDPI
tara:strand:+ start:1063 stop:3546 length:2484 start_codon:yes stop_codon:yes gene_type:complete